MITKSDTKIDGYDPYDVLFLEDDPVRIPGLTKLFESVGANITWTDTARDCISLLKNNTFDIIFLDHDLGGEVYVDSNREDTGAEVARWIGDNLDDDTIVILHSLNAPGSENMSNSVPWAIKEPCCWLIGLKTVEIGYKPAK